MNDTAVIYFSRDGSTKLAAHIIAEKLGAQCIELEEKKKSRNFLLSGFRAAAKKHTTLAGDPWGAIQDCSRVVIGSPIWAGNGNPATNGFLDKADLTGKKVYLFTVQADPEMASAAGVLSHFTQRVAEAGGSVAGSFALYGASPGKCAEKARLEQDLSEWELLH